MNLSFTDPDTLWQKFLRFLRKRAHIHDWQHCGTLHYRTRAVYQYRCHSCKKYKNSSVYY